jgi:prepilin-type N-terminal cleavage/methylation domain-containing protein
MRTARQAGFTLVELVMVIIIIGVMAVFVVPRALDLTEWRLQAYGDELQVQSMAMHRLALVQRRPVTVVFRTTGVSFAYTDGDTLLELPCPAAASPCFSAGIPSSATFNALNAGRTSTSAAGALVVTLSAGDSSRSFRLEEETGLFRPAP